VYINSGLCFPTAGGGVMCVAWPDAAIATAIVVAVLAAALVPLLVSSRRTPTVSEAAVRANRHATLGSVAGATLLVAVLVVFAFLSVVVPMVGSGRVIAVLPAVAGLCLVLAQALTQVTWPRPSGVVREADLTRRTRPDVVPSRTHRLLLVWTGALLVALAVFVAVSSGPRTIADRLTAGAPYPGPYYALPLALAAVVLVVATELVLRLVLLRPAVPGVSRDWDLHLRRRSARHLVGGVQLALAVMLTGALALAGFAHRSAGPAPAGAVLLAVAAAVALVSVVALLPAPRRRSAARTEAAAATP
jgi:hypothetical protein